MSRAKTFNASYSTASPPAEDEATLADNRRAESPAKHGDASACNENCYLVAQPLTAEWRTSTVISTFSLSSERFDFLIRIIAAGDAIGAWDK